MIVSYLSLIINISLFKGKLYPAKILGVFAYKEDIIDKRVRLPKTILYIEIRYHTQKYD